jgi:AraC family transcriptional regulator of adaptative response/methylated-DNA-[protein]-cysteine methyltransferase
MSVNTCVHRLAIAVLIPQKPLSAKKNQPTLRPMNSDLITAVTPTRLGFMRCTATQRGLCAVSFEDATPTEKDSPDALSLWITALNNHLEHQHPFDAALPLDVGGTPFQRAVWQYLQTIPAGEVRSYAEVAAAIGKPAAVRAVASACAKNTLALVIPCHRVMRSDGSLGGYRWGVERKRALLKAEGSVG